MSVKPSTSHQDRVQELIVHAAAIADGRGDPTASLRLTDLKTRIERAEFNVAVLGEFKRGKSSLINALLGVAVLPTGVLPLTSVVTRLRWGEVPGAVIRFKDGTTRSVPPDQLVEFVTESGNPRNQLQVTAAEVAVSSDLLRGGVVLLDTPGVGSIFEHNTDTTLRLLSDVDAAIFVTAADPPISGHERSFLTLVKEHAHKTFFVLNKIDVLEIAELDEIRSFTHSVIRDAVDQGVETFPVSARRALQEGDAGLEALAHALRAFIGRDLAGTGTASIARKAGEVIAWLRTGIAVELDALHLSVEEIACRRDELATVRRDADRARLELEALVEAGATLLVEDIEQELAAWRSKERAGLIEDARRAIEDDEVRPADLDRHIKDLLRSHVETWRPQIEGLVQSGFSREAARFIEQANEAAVGATAAASQILKLDLPPAPSIDGLSTKRRFSYASFEVPTLMESLLPDAAAVLPKGLAGRIALRRARQRIPGLVDMHSGRLRHDLVTRLKASADGLIRDLGRHLAGTTEALETALVRAMGSIDELESAEERTSEGLISLDEELFRLNDRLWDTVRDLHESAP